MTIDEKANDEKVIVVRAGKKLTKFEDITKELYRIAKKETKFKGDFTNTEERNKYFSKYEIGPAFEDEVIVGFQLRYSINAHAEPEKKSRAGSGCGPGKDYSF